MLNKLSCLCGRQPPTPPLPSHLRTQSDEVDTPRAGYKQFRRHGPTTESSPYIPNIERPLPVNRRLNYTDEGMPAAPQPQFRPRQPGQNPSPQWVENENTQYARASFDRSNKWLPYTPPNSFADWGYFPSSATPNSADLTPFEVRAALDRADRVERERIQLDLEKMQDERRKLVESQNTDDDDSFQSAQEALSRTEEEESEKIMGDLENMQTERRKLVLSQN